jgi:hypothetical protein
MAKLYRSDDVATIELCDEVCAVVRNGQLTLRERWVKLIPIVVKWRDSQFQPEH